VFGNRAAWVRVRARVRVMIHVRVGVVVGVRAVGNQPAAERDALLPSTANHK
jgi:hypothetical protein